MKILPNFLQGGMIMKICKLMGLIELMNDNFHEFTIDGIKFYSGTIKDTIQINYNKMIFLFYLREENLIKLKESKIYAEQNEDYALWLPISYEPQAIIREDDQNSLKEIVDRLVDKGYNFFIYKDDEMVLSYTNEFCTGQGFQIPNGKPKFVEGMDNNHINLRVPILG